MQRNTSFILGVSHRTYLSLTSNSKSFTVSSIPKRNLNNSKSITSLKLSSNKSYSKATTHEPLRYDNSNFQTVRRLNTDSASVVGTEPDRNSDDFKENQERMQTLVNELRDRTAVIVRGGGEKAVERHTSRGKLVARERIPTFIFPVSPAILT